MQGTLTLRVLRECRLTWIEGSNLGGVGGLVGRTRDITLMGNKVIHVRKIKS